jgi:hypothetical protein
MRRSLDDALAALRQLIDDWAHGRAGQSLRLLVYPPEWEAALLARLPVFAATSAAAGHSFELVDAGQVLLDALDQQDDAEALIEEEKLGQDLLLSDLNLIATERLVALLQQPLPPPNICRLVCNSGALATIISYSAVANQAAASLQAPAVIAFPGEGDERSLNLLRLRHDASYRIPRI